MGFFDFWRRVFEGEDVDAELKAARARHGINVDEKDEKEAEEEKEPFDPWEEVSNARVNFFLGSWVNRKFHVIGEDKVKRQLEELERKRQEEEAQQKKEEE